MAFKPLLIAAAFAAGAVAMAGPAAAQLYIVPNGGVTDSADPEPQTAGGPGFPTNLVGYQHDAALYVSSTNVYRFTYLGSGNSVDTNTFSLLGNAFLSVGVGGTGPGSTPVYSHFDVELAAGTLIPFSYTNLSSQCSMANGSGVTGPENCHYLLALADSPGPVPAIDPQLTAYIGWSDRPSNDIPTHTGDHDFQDLTVRVDAVPEPASLALVAVGLLGLGMARRRRA